MTEIYVQGEQERYPVNEIWREGAETDPSTGKPYMYLDCLEVSEETESRWRKTFADFDAVQGEIESMIDAARRKEGRRVD